jgi:hypothetical protein
MTYGPKWGSGDVIGVVLDRPGQRLGFTLNGAWLGWAFEGHNFTAEAVVPAAWTTVAGTRLAMGVPESCATVNDVSPPGESNVPFVTATKYPGGQLAVGTLGRTSPRPLGCDNSSTHTYVLCG